MRNSQLLKVFFVLILISITVSGCKTLDRSLISGTPVYDDVHIYEAPFDLTFLNVLESIDYVDKWEVEFTDKTKGLIRIRNLNFSRFDDADEREATIIVKRLNRKQTSVQLAPFSQRVVQIGEIMRLIDRYITGTL